MQLTQPATEMVPVVAWYHQKWFVVLMLILFMPVGLALLWSSPLTKRDGRIVWTIIMSVAFAARLVAADPTGISKALLTPSRTSSSTTAKPSGQTVDGVNAAATTIRFDDLARDPNHYRGQAVLYDGEVIQVAGTTSHPVYRVNVTEGKYGWTDTIWVNAPANPRVLERDIIRLWGTVKGEREYNGLFGTGVRVPEVDAVEVQVTTKAGDRK
jgi:hypothetical protein